MFTSRTPQSYWISVFTSPLKVRNGACVPGGGVCADLLVSWSGYRGGISKKIEERALGKQEEA